MSFGHVLVTGTTKLTLVYCDTQSVELLLVRVVLSMHKLVQKHTNASVTEKRLTNSCRYSSRVREMVTAVL